MATRQLYVHVFMPLMAALALGWATTAAADTLPATGQTTSFREDDDGDIRAGKPLNYKDEGDGTIEDKVTDLVWEKKSDDGGLHDKDDLYTWDEAFDYVATLNNICANDELVDCSADADCVAAGVGGRCGFAGNRDWRLPNVKELQSIVNYQNFSPPVSPEFHSDDNCFPGATVLTGSCTEASIYWSSTTAAFVSGGADAWFVEFFGGSVGAFNKVFDLFVRAVRGGSP
jgi:hypothetical protein